MKKEYIDLEDLIRPFHANVAWTHKIQEKQAEIYNKKYARIATINIFAASITSAGILSTIFADQMWLKIVSAVVSFVTVFLTALLKAFDFKEMAKANKSAATKLVILRDELRLLLHKVRKEMQPVAELTEEFADIQRRVHAVYQDAPQTTDKAVTMAGVALYERKDNTYTEEEMDMLLPESLRRGTQGE